MGVVERPPRSADVGDPRLEAASNPRRRFEEQQTQQMIDLHAPFGSAEQPDQSTVLRLSSWCLRSA
jgi:hypothetical protein